MKQFKVKPLITIRSENINRYLTDINEYNCITPEEEVELAYKIKEGDHKAVNRLVEANLRFVVTVAKQYQGNGLELEDLINEGNIGLITAAYKFDPTKGFKFISYAVWWVRQSILQALANTGRMVRLPLNKIEDVSKVNQTIIQFIQEQQREPTINEIVEITSVPFDKVKFTETISAKHISLNSPINENEDTLLDIKCDETTPSPDKEENTKSLKHDINTILNILTEREQSIIKKFFGIDEEQMTLEEISECFNLTRERVRQIKDLALDKLKNSKFSKILKQHLN